MVCSEYSLQAWTASKEISSSSSFPSQSLPDLWSIEKKLKYYLFADLLSKTLGGKHSGDTLVWFIGLLYLLEVERWGVVMRCCIWPACLWGIFATEFLHAAVFSPVIQVWRNCISKDFMKLNFIRWQSCFGILEVKLQCKGQISNYHLSALFSKAT